MKQEAFTTRNILSVWSKTGLRPFNPERVLRDIQKRPAEAEELQTSDNFPNIADIPDTPVSPRKPALLRSQVEQDAHQLEASCKLRLQKMLNSTERATAERSLLLQQNQDMFQQNNEKKARQRIKSTVVGKAKIMMFEDIAIAKRKREEKEAVREVKRKTKKSALTRDMTPTVSYTEGKSHQEQLRGIEEYCSIIQID